MKARWLKRDNNGVDEKFYPITHVDAIVMGEGDEPMGEHFKDTNNPHNVTAEQVGALPKTGGTVSGNLGLNAGIGLVEAYTNNASLRIRNKANDDSNSRRIQILASSSKTISESLRLSDTINGTPTNYLIFGEHNKELLASTVENLMANGGMSTLQSAIQVTNAVLIGSSTAFTGTGKGKLFLTGGNESIVAEIVIDGKTLNTVKFANSNTTIELEFLKSFSVKNTSNGYYIYANAVFY